MKPEYILTAVTIVVLLVAAQITYSLNQKKGREGKDQRRIRDIAARMMGGAPFYTVVYARYQTGWQVTHHASYIFSGCNRPPRCRIAFESSPAIFTIRKIWFYPFNRG